MSLNTARNRGFTLVELLLVISIMLIMAGAMIPSFSTYLRNQTLKQTQERIKSDIRTVQNKALTGALYDQRVDRGGVATNVTHWGIRFNNNAQRYDYFLAAASTGAQFLAECNTYYDDAQGVGTIARGQGFANLPDDMVFKTVSGCLFFSFRNGGVTAAGAGFASPVRFGYSNSNAAGNCRNIMYNTAGLIFNTNTDTCL